MKQIVLSFGFGVLIAIAVGAIAVPLLGKIKAKQYVSKYVEEHKSKSGTPTMGGLFLVFAGIATFLLFNDTEARVAYVVLAVTAAYMFVGFLDDYIKIRDKHNEGLTALQKILFQSAIALIVAYYAYSGGITELALPFSKEYFNIGVFSLPLYFFVFLATTNSVNLTDGLDGLSGGVSYIYLLAFAALLYYESVGGGRINNYYEYRSMILLAVSFAAVIIGFLLFNTNKASVFMGDSGSLALGGLIAALGIFSGNSLYIPILGIMFAISSISVIIQVIYYKRTKKRAFLMAPLHHHFQQKGFTECKIAFCYKLITLLVGLSVLIPFLQ